MTLTALPDLPGGKDLDDQYSPGANIHKSLAILKRLMSGGGYHFGHITAEYFHLTGQDRQKWLDECGTYAQNVKDGIKDAVVQALGHKDANGNPAPVQVKFTWVQNGGTPDVEIIYQPSVPLYTIQILNCQSLLASALAERQNRKKK